MRLDPAFLPQPCKRLKIGLLRGARQIIGHDCEPPTVRPPIISVG
jgi:hypothetical protein